MAYMVLLFGEWDVTSRQRELTQAVQQHAPTLDSLDITAQSRECGNVQWQHRIQGGNGRIPHLASAPASKRAISCASRSSTTA